MVVVMVSMTVPVKLPVITWTRKGDGIGDGIGGGIGDDIGDGISHGIGDGIGVSIGDGIGIWYWHLVSIYSGDPLI